MFLTNNSIIDEDVNFEYKSTNNIYEDLINNSERYLNEILNKNNLSLKKIYNESLIVEKPKNNENKYQGVYIHLCDKLEKRLFQIYKYLTKKIPIAQNILLCSKETTNEELTAFIYRAILCEYNSCFIMGGVELLEFDKKKRFLELLKKLYDDKHEEMKSCLIILYTDKSVDIIKSLELLKNKKILNISNNDFDSQKIDNDTLVEVISSDQCGVGKTTHIKSEFKEEEYIHFPLGGIFNRKDIMKRLKELDFSNKKSYSFRFI